ncbi:MAG: DUF72 domain-containing protein [Candidatus Omnitrophica bacterium]|nr:DUF72 domain-containing protein [Candidatus Omnitrophota bacterium]
MAENGQVHIGTSGWHYDHWKKNFYPEGVNNGAMLDYYAEKLDSVEINNAFYRLPEKKTFRAWAGKVPRDFIFSVKASRYITHMKKLRTVKRPVNKVLNTVKALGGKLGPILFQLPPRWKKNTSRLEHFLSLLPEENRYAFEFRDPSWFSDDVYDALREKNAAFCIYHLAGRMSPKILTGDFAYIRLHGPKGAYKGRYTGGDLAGWAGAISAWRRNGNDVYCYFDNDQKGYAAENAVELHGMTG